MRKAVRVAVLDPIVAERIAAGEVIERPASVIKELLENSLDAGATEVSVSVQDGGKALIEVLDNGAGIHPDDLAVCVRRHATSKIRALEDLESLATLGFRGEALPSIGAVSELTILSRAIDQPSAYQFDFASGQTEPATFGHFLGSPHGTRIQAHGLFAQIPARLKFLKSQASEVGQIREWMERLALTHPRTGFKLLSNERVILNLRPQSEEARVREILGDGGDYPLVTREEELGSLRVRAHWLQGLSSPQTRKLVQIVNGRAVRDRLLQQAMLSSFRQALLPGQFPAVALYLELDPADVDVNVHPTKTELRFLRSREVFHEIQRLVERMVGETGAPAYVPSTEGAAAPSPWSFSGQRGFNSPGNQDGLFPKWANRAPGTGPVTFRASETSHLQAPAHSPLAYPHPGESYRPFSPATENADGPVGPAHPFEEGRYAGTLFNTYILYDLGTETALIDQHAAHERIRYELLRARAQGRAELETRSQQLLIPEVVHFAPEERPLVEPRLEILDQLGFQAEIFGENSVLFRSVPAEWGSADLAPRLKNMLERLIAAESDQASSHALALDERLFEKLASEACHSAIRAGDALEPAEAQALVLDLFRCEHPWNCPHGRPTVVRLPKGRFEEWFQRRVPH